MNLYKHRKTSRLLENKTSNITIVILTGLLISLFCGCAKDENILLSEGPPSEDYVLLFEDDFNHLSLKNEDWFERDGYRLGGLNLKSNVMVQNGMVSLLFKHEDHDGDEVYDYTGGGIISKHLFGYGYYEIKVKIYGITPGFHQSFWSMGLDFGMQKEYDEMIKRYEVPYYNTVIEIDGFEIESQFPRTLKTNFHKWTPSHLELGSIPYNLSYEDWFIAGFEWGQGYVNYFLNGELMVTRQIDSTLYSPQSHWLTAVADINKYDDIDRVSPIENASMDIDYFRYYSRKRKGLNLIGNHSFELNKKPGRHQIKNYPVSWIEPFDPINDLGTGWVVEDDSAHSGTHYLVHSSTNNFQITTEQLLEFIPNGTYRLIAWVMLSSGQIDAKMQVSGSGDGLKTIKIQPSRFWKKIEIENINVATNTARIAFSSEGDPNEWFFIDDVSFELMD